MVIILLFTFFLHVFLRFIAYTFLRNVLLTWTYLYFFSERNHTLCVQTLLLSLNVVLVCLFNLILIIKFHSLVLLDNIALYEYTVYITMWWHHTYQNHNEIRTMKPKFQFISPLSADECSQCSCLANIGFVWLDFLLVQQVSLWSYFAFHWLIIKSNIIS